MPMDFLPVILAIHANMLPDDRPLPSLIGRAYLWLGAHHGTTRFMISIDFTAAVAVARVPRLAVSRPASAMVSFSPPAPASLQNLQKVARHSRTSHNLSLTLTIGHVTLTHSHDCVELTLVSPKHSRFSGFRHLGFYQVCGGQLVKRLFSASKYKNYSMSNCQC